MNKMGKVRILECLVAGNEGIVSKQAGKLVIRVQGEKCCDGDIQYIVGVYRVST